jgi:hypothetical protein
MKDSAITFFEYTKLYMNTTCPNGAARCTGVEHCPYNSNYPSNYKICEVKEYLNKLEKQEVFL